MADDLEMRLKTIAEEISSIGLMNETRLGRIAGFKEALVALNGSDPSGSIRRKLEDKIRKEEQAYSEGRNGLAAARGRAEAIRESMRLMGQLNDEQSSPELRPGSELHKVRQFLLSQGKPMPLNEILIGIGKQDTPDNRNSLRGSLGRYARSGFHFLKTAPNTFGLSSYKQDSVLPEEDPDKPFEP